MKSTGVNHNGMTAQRSAGFQPAGAELFSKAVIHHFLLPSTGRRIKDEGWCHQYNRCFFTTAKSVTRHACRASFLT